MFDGCTTIAEKASVADIGMLVVAIVAAVLGLWQYVSNHENDIA